MRRPWWFMIVLGGLIAAAPAGSGDLERNRRLLALWRKDEHHYERLKADLHAFNALPADRQEQLRKIDHELNRPNEPAEQARLWAVLDRYRTWLDRLPEADRTAVLAIKDPDQRVERIRQMRHQEWLSALPAQLHAELLALPEDRRAARIAELRRQQQTDRRFWLRGAAAFRSVQELCPERLEDFPPEVKAFVRAHLLPRLNTVEQTQLAAAQGKWPDVVRVIRELSDRHPVLPPRGTPIVRKSQLPLFIPAGAPLPRQMSQWDLTLKKFEGRWPDYALEVLQTYDETCRKYLTQPLGACRLEEFPAEMREYIHDHLLPALDSDQLKRVKATEGHWPEYPKLLLKLAREKDRPIPGMSLPGPRELWAASFSFLMKTGPRRPSLRFEADPPGAGMGR